MGLKIDSAAAAIRMSKMADHAENEVKNEPMLFNCNFEGASRLGGGLTLDFLSLLPDDWKDGPLVIDSRVHMLMKGWYPCIPGWHHDDVPRTRSDGQPNYGPGQARSEHIIALVNADICPTEFALGEAWFQEPPLGSVLYEKWHHDVEMMLDNRILRRVRYEDRQLIRFDDRTWHQGTAAVGNGWRFFIRASRYKDHKGNRIDRGNPRTNEVRQQVQVYMNNPFKGW